MSSMINVGTNAEVDAEHFHREGFFIARGLISSPEAAGFIEHFMRLHARAPFPGYDTPLTEAEADGDILKMYPRVMQPHRFDAVAKKMLLDERIWAVLRLVLGGEPIAAQSMFYFKPPGAKGQAFHQDNFYLNVRPGTCTAAWLALEDTDRENGGLMVAPRTNTLDIACPTAADQAEFFTSHHVDIPGGDEPVEVKLAAGDCLFFNGSLIHGSYRNASKDRWRRAFICHYAPAAEAKEVSRGYFPLLNKAGAEVRLNYAPADNGVCGGEDGNWAR